MILSTKPNALLAFCEVNFKVELKLLDKKQYFRNLKFKNKKNDT